MGYSVSSRNGTENAHAPAVDGGDRNGGSIHQSWIPLLPNVIDQRAATKGFPLPKSLSSPLRCIELVVACPALSAGWTLQAAPAHLAGRKWAAIEVSQNRTPDRMQFFKNRRKSSIPIVALIRAVCSTPRSPMPRCSRRPPLICVPQRPQRLKVCSERINRRGR